jgi:hypothetical protein
LGAGCASASLPSSVCNDQGTTVSATAKVKLDIILVILDLDRCGILSLICEQKILGFLDFWRHGDMMCREHRLALPKTLTETLVSPSKVAFLQQS